MTPENEIEVKVYVERDSDLPPIGLLDMSADCRAWSIKGTVLARLVDGKPAVGDGVKLVSGGFYLSGDGRLVTVANKTTTAFRFFLPAETAIDLNKKYPTWVLISDRSNNAKGK